MLILKQPFSVLDNTFKRAALKQCDLKSSFNHSLAIKIDKVIVDLCEENINFKCSSWDLTITIIDIIIGITIDIVACYSLTYCKADKDNQ